MTRTMIEVENVTKHFPVKRGPFSRTTWVKAVDGVSFGVQQGETLGLVGESGSGKSTLGKTIVGIFSPTAGQVKFEGREISGLSGQERKAVRRNLQYSYQDPGAALNPRWRIHRSLSEPLIVHTNLSRKERLERVESTLTDVGLPRTHLDLYPHELSGGQQRRAGLARILVLRPKVIILDEPTSGLDVSIQASIINLFQELRKKFDLSYVFISHDLGVVRLMCDRIAVMYLGELVELRPTEEVFAGPVHPYTRSLLAAVPQIGGPRLTDRLRSTL